MIKGDKEPNSYYNVFERDEQNEKRGNDFTRTYKDVNPII